MVAKVSHKPVLKLGIFFHQRSKKIIVLTATNSQPENRFQHLSLQTLWNLHLAEKVLCDISQSIKVEKPSKIGHD